MNALQQPRLTLKEYLVWEEQQPGRHEYHRGEVFAMAGGKRIHGDVVTNLVRELSIRLKGSPCRVYCESMKVQVGDDTILYPDVFVTCHRADLSTEQVFQAPTVVIEVLSPSTQSYDRSAKFALYRELASLREYVLIDPETHRIDAFRQESDGRWMLVDPHRVGVLELRSIEVSIPLAEVFDGVDPPAEAVAAGS